MKDELSIETWRSDWLQKVGEPFSWKDLEERKGKDGTSEQSFWRGDRQTSRSLTDEQMVERGALLESADGELYHVAYIPWNRPGFDLSKEEWDKDQWSEFDQIVRQCRNFHHSIMKNYNWERLTINSALAQEFLKADIKDSYIFGDVSGDHMLSTHLTSNLIDGEFGGAIRGFSNTTILNRVRVHNSTLAIENSNIFQLVVHSTNTSKHNIEINGTKIVRFEAGGHFGRLKLADTLIGDADLSGTTLASISLDNSELALGLEGSTIAGRFEARQATLQTNFENHVRTWEDAKFQEKVRIVQCKLPISLFADTQLEAPIDIHLSSGAIEDQFELDLKNSRNPPSLISTSSNMSNPERLRRRLESSCQIISERHRQDGRRDLEYRFRRMELKARAYNEGAKAGTKALNVAYDTFSDFGRSFMRPSIGLVTVYLAFAALYWLIAAYDQGLVIVGKGAIKAETLVDAALLAADKTFPFGASVDESKLFDGEIVGEKGGALAVAIGLLGAFQTALSGIMLFLMGLAIRTKLLIG